MNINLLKESVGKDESLKVTRPCWNKDFLEFWVEILWENKRLIYKSEPSEYIIYKGFTRCKDGTIVPYAFSLDQEDFVADDWVII